MKKTISLLLALVMCLSLCACGKSEEVIAVEEKIASIGEITDDSTDAINDARDAYDALSDEDKAKVENASSLHEAIFESLVIRCNELNRQSSILSEGVMIVWENVGGSKFWDYFDDVLRFNDFCVIEDMKFLNELSTVQILMWYTGYAMEPESFDYGECGRPEDLTDDDFIYIAGLCMPYAKAYAALPEMETDLNSDISQFVKDYKNTYPEKTNLLHEWMLESSMFAEFALEPSGNLADYETKLKEYETMMSRFQKEAEMLK